VTRNIRRWSDNDHHFGPFTFAYDRRYKPISVVLSSAEEDHPGCNLRISAFGLTLITELPGIIKPHKQQVFPQCWDAATIDRLGRNWYWDVSLRRYGFSVSEGFLQVFLGRETGDSSTTQSWSKFLPWTQWRFIRHSLYGADGSHFWTESDEDKKNWMAHREAKDECSSLSFEFDDFDGERITVKTIIEEREWKFGEGWFKWLSLFRKAKVSRSLDLEFSKETGKRKGSWKGGTIGHSIEMIPGELHESAFRRYCSEHEMTFIGGAA
jgi:hypothetical protein